MVKEVKKELSQEVKKTFLLNHILEGLESGKIPIQLSKELNISKQNMSYYLRDLKKKGIIERVGYGVWQVNKEVKKSINDTNSLGIKKVRGHAYIWKVKIKIKNWDKRIEILKKLNIPYKLVGIKQTPRIIINNQKVWLCNKSLIVYSSASFYGKTSPEALKYAVESLLEILRTIENKLGITLKPYIFRTNKEHYSLIKNSLAIQCNRNNEKINIYENGSRWLVIDDSLEQGGELETEKGGVIINKELQDWWNDNKKHKFGVTPSFVLKVMNGIQQNQLIFDKNMKSHIDAIQNLSKGVKKLTKVMGGILRENRDLKLKSKHQLTLLNYEN